MQPLNLENTYRVVLPVAEQLNVVLAGIGGTGSALALALGRLAYHLKVKGVAVRMLFVDHDLISRRNLGRQLFCEAEVGANKAECLAFRVNAAFGLDIASAPLPFTAERFAGWTAEWEQRRPGNHLLIGAVDNYRARRELGKVIEAQRGRWYGLDLGNEFHSGQVLIGNTTDPDAVRFDKLGLCTALPCPYLQEPALLEAPPAGAEPRSCAELAEREKQSLVVNSMAAALGAEYAYQFLVRRELVQMASYFTLSPPATKSVAITESAVSACFPA